MPRSFKRSNKRLIRVLEEQSLDRLNIVDEIAVKSNAVNDGQVIRLAKRQIVDAIGRCRVHDTGTALRADEVRGEHLERIGRINFDVIEKLLVTGADEFGALHRLRRRCVRCP